MGRKKGEEPKEKRISICLSAKEYFELQQMQAQTTCPTLSYYLRQVIFQREVVFLYRNKSMDEILIELSKIQQSLEYLELYKKENTLSSSSHINEKQGQINDQIMEQLSQLNELITRLLELCLHESMR